MKKIALGFALLVGLTAFRPAVAQDVPQDPGAGNSYPANVDLDERKEGGWFLGSDQGVLFFVGTSGDFIGTQFYSSVFGGYNIKGIIQPMLRIASAIGGTKNFLFNPTTFFFMMDGGFRITPLRTKFRPFFIGTVGFYHLDFNDFGFPIFDDTNFTFTAGGGLEYKFGPSRINVASEYRGMINDGIDLRGVQVTLGYAFQF